MTQLPLDFSVTPACACGAALVSSINHYRALCDRCILRRTIAGHVWNEDPAAKRAHLAQWLAARDRSA